LLPLARGAFLLLLFFFKVCVRKKHSKTGVFEACVSPVHVLFTVLMNCNLDEISSDKFDSSNWGSIILLLELAASVEQLPMGIFKL
jgi:di/tricarboxylate transporter